MSWIIDCTNSATIDRRLAGFVSTATQATFTLLLERTTRLPDGEMMIIANALRTCGMIADETGHLLPRLYSEIRSAAFLQNDAPAQQRRLLGVLADPESTHWIYGRSIHADAVQSLAELLRTDTSESPVSIRRLLSSQIDRKVYSTLIDACDSFRACVKEVERLSIDPPPGSWAWMHHYYEAIMSYEVIGRRAIS